MHLLSVFACDFVFRLMRMAFSEIHQCISKEDKEEKRLCRVSKTL